MMSRFRNLSTVARRPRHVVALLLGVGAFGSIIGALLDPRRAAAAYLASYEAVLSTVLGLLMLLMTIELTGGRWLEAFRQSALRITGAIPILAILFVPVLLAGLALYPWAGSASLTPAMRQTIQAKWPYLTPLFAVIRAIVYWVVWIGVGELFRRSAARREMKPDEDSDRRMRRLSIGGIIGLGLTTTFAGFDWLMSLAPDFQSSIFGLYWYAGATVAAFAALAVVSGVGGRRMGAVDDADARHALGNLLLTFLLVWAYFAYSQFLIVWIAHVPSEVGWLATRTRGGWAALAVVVAIGQFALPFPLLLVRQVKRARGAMAAIGIWVLFMHLLDMYWLVGPQGSRRGIGFLWVDVATFLFVSVATIAAVSWRDGAHTQAAAESASLGSGVPGMRAELS